MVAMPVPEGAPRVVPLDQALADLSYNDTVEILCTQERAYGSHGLEPPDVLS